MATIRTLNFLPEIFQTPSNSQFLAATLDQLVNPPVVQKIQGYIGSKFGYGVNANDYYVTENTKARRDYQLDPGIVFTKNNETVAKDFLSYPGLLDAIKNYGGLTNNNSNLFNSQYYSWDSFTNLDALINFNQYYWLSDGPPAVTVASATVFSKQTFIVRSLPNGYVISTEGQTGGSVNPTLTLLRGGTYTFRIDQDSEFWIQSERSVTGFSPVQPNLYVRDVFGVNPNGVRNGEVIFEVPAKNAQDSFNYPGDVRIDLVTNKRYKDVSGKKLSQIVAAGGIDGVTNLEGLVVLFFNGLTNEIADLGAYDIQQYDQTQPGLDLPYDTNLYVSNTSQNFYRVFYYENPDDENDPFVILRPDSEIPIDTKITPNLGIEFINLHFYKNSTGPVRQIPLITAPLDILYYQDGTDSNKTGVIRLIESNITNTLNVETDILGKKNFTSTNGIKFTNGLKVKFDGDILPTSYLEGEYYVQGVGTAIELIPVDVLIAPEPFATFTSVPYDALPYDITPFDAEVFLSEYPDYITIARNSIDKNAWSRSNRWFHIDVIKATAEYNNNPDILTQYGTYENKAKRPIIEFYPNLKLFNTGVVGKNPIDFIDFRNTDAFSEVENQLQYYPDVEVYSSNTGTLASVVNGTSTTLTIARDQIQNTIQVDQYIQTSNNELPENAYISSITGTETAVITIEWDNPTTIIGGNNIGLVASDIYLANYALFPGARIVFANDENESIRTKIYVVNYNSLSEGSAKVITLTEAPDSEILINNQLVIFRGYYNQGKSYYFDGLDYNLAQQKITVNQPPLFDIFDKNGISLSEQTIYQGSSFIGCKLFSYTIGEGNDDAVLGFPLAYSQIDNVGDIAFTVNLNSDTFNYVKDSLPITENVNIGYVYNYVDLVNKNRLLGWQTAVAESVQYQLFSFEYTPLIENISIPINTVISYSVKVDVAPISQDKIEWPVLQVYNNNIFLSYTENTTPNFNEYTIVSRTDNSITIKAGILADVKTEIQVLVLSDQVSEKAYFTIPINLSNNPFNENITDVNVGDIRGHYQSIFRNCPDSEGLLFGPNNYRDLGNVVPFGNRIIQNSASLVLPGAFLRKQNYNFFDALLFNSREYIKYKTAIVDIVANSDYNQRFDASYMLDDAVERISSYKDEVQPFFWSDMIPSKSVKITNTYDFANNLDTSIFPLSQVYNFNTANYNGVLIYVNRTVDGINSTKQLIKGVDYIISETKPSVTVTYDLIAGDQVIIKEYDKTYGSFVPNTPTKLGLYPATIPQVVLDNSYSIPTYFIIGHDGSYNKLYGEYDATYGILFDFRDQVLLEFETRIYNNLKLGEVIPLRDYEILPNFYNEGDYTYNQWLEMYSTSFLDWVGQNRLDYKRQLYNANNQFTYNYRDAGSERVDNVIISQGFWRGINQYFFNTTTPNLYPWQMLGYTNQPTWWTDRYGPAPYTSGNLIMWQDIFDGIDWNNGDIRIIIDLKRSVATTGTDAWQTEFNNFMKILPVGSAGELLSPINSVVGNYNPKNLRKDWAPGDLAPVELSYRRSSTWPFDLMRLFAITKPAKFFNLGADLDNYRYNAEFNQYLVNDRSHLVIDNIQIYGNGVPKTSYINWIVDYEKLLGAGATDNVKALLYNLDVRLVYRLAGFSDKTLLKFYVEKGTPNSRDASLLIPDESYALLLYENQPSEKLMYSSVIVQALPNGYAVYGNSQTHAFFKILKPIFTGTFETLKVDQASVKVSNQFSTKEEVVPYGTIFYSTQELSQFLLAYGRWLETRGAVFDTIQNGVPVDWSSMVLEFLYWTQLGFEPGSIMTLNPAAKVLKVNKESLIVQPLTLQETNFVLNQNLYPIQLKDLNIVRNGTEFNVKPLNTGDAIAYGQFNLSNFEHGIVFDNTTLFDDIIYNLQTGLRQTRITIRGRKTAEWNGTIFASGFILNQDNITEWSKSQVYTKGAIVKFKNKYWTALKIIQPANVFQEKDWKETDYNEIQKGLLPNSSTRSFESALYYNVDEANLEQDADQLSFSLIGYRPRDYLALADLTDITQINVYKNFIKNKGTRNSVSAFKGANLPQGGIDYEVYENWAIKQAEYGGVLNNNFVEMRLNEPLLTSNPFTVALTNGSYTPGIQQEVPIYNLYNYSRPVTDPNVFPTVSQYEPSTLFPDAGYASADDVKMMSYFMPSLSVAVDKSGLIVPLAQLYVRDYVWIANDLGTWKIFTPESIGQVVSAVYNTDGTTTITFAQPHNLKQFDVFAIVGFNIQVDGYYTVDAVLNLRQIVITLSFLSNLRVINGVGVALKFVNQRVETPADIIDLPLLNAEFIKNTVWVDENSDGGWAVYRKSLNYEYEKEFTKQNSEKFGSAVLYNSKAGYLISDSALGKVYRYTFNVLFKEYLIDEELTGNVSFGTSIVNEQNLYAISQPENSPCVRIYVINESKFGDDLTLLQTITNPSDDENFGIGLALSGDTNWLYVSNFDQDNISAKNNVHVYRKQNVQTNAGSFVAGQVYQITSLGTQVTASQIVVGQTYRILFVGNTDFTLIGASSNDEGVTFVATGTTTGSGLCLEDPTDFVALGALENKVGIYFVANNVGSGTGIANLCSYQYIDTISSGETTVDKFGYSISTNYYGDTVTIGAPNKKYSTNIERYGKSYVYSRSVQNYEAQTSNPISFELAWTPTVGEPLFVSRNGTLVQSSNYNYSGSIFNYTGTCNPGDIINVSGNKFTLVQELETDEAPRIGVQFGYSVDNNKFATEILIGAPFALNSVNQEGAVYRYTNGGNSYGTVVGVNECNVTVPRKLLINGYAVLVNGTANDVANQIIEADITNVTAIATNNVLTIGVINQNLTQVNQKLNLTTTDPNLFNELGIQIYSQTQIITCPHQTGPTQFGTKVKFNEHNSVVVSAPVGQRYAATTFDFIDDENSDNDTVFDNNATQFIDSWNNAGAVYMFDYLSVNNENINNSGVYVYAQSVNARNQKYGAQPRYGTALDFNENRVVIGTPNFSSDTVDGQVITYINPTGLQDWSVYRQTAPIVDINKIENIQLFSAETNNTLVNLDYFDPLQGKLLGAIRQNIDVISNVDPASYNLVDPNANTNSIAWGAAQEGTIWFDTTNIRYFNYHQNDPVYNALYWGQLFPGSNVAVYTWVASSVVPSSYTGPGIPYDISKFSVQTVIDSSSNIAPVYYFWVRNTNLVYKGKTISDFGIANYLANPQETGISYLTPLLPNAVAVYNSQQFVNANDTVLHVGYQSGSNDVLHNEYTLIRSNFADDFLPGIPDPRTNKQPEGLYDRMLDSLAGVDELGQVVPNPWLPKTVQSGILARPRQSFFYNRFTAIQNYLTYANTILSQYPITEIKITPFLFKSGEYYDVQNYWEYVNYWVAPYNNNTRSAFQVPLYSDLLELDVDIGTIVTVAKNGQGLQETYIYELDTLTQNPVWMRIGLQNGTIRFKTELWDYSGARIGFGDNFFDTDAYDVYPSEETRWIVRSLNEEIYTNELLIHRNRSLVLLFDYIQSETIENQNYLPWLNKTSLADVNHKIRELLPYEVFKSDNQEFLAGYLNEVKPYHVVIKDFLFTYEGNETYQGDVTDFDLPAQYSNRLGKFLTPELVYDKPKGNNQFLPNNNIWENPEYTQWFANKGMSLTGINDYQMSKLNNYLTAGFNEFIAVENASGFPINGVITIGTEDISYSRIDRLNNLLLGITRGFNETTATVHIPGEIIYMDLPAVVVVNGGTQYNPGIPPKVNVIYDTELYGEPTVPAELSVTMANDVVTAITVINPGQGYIVTPTIEIDPSLIISFDSASVNTTTNSITIFAPLLVTGDEVRYVQGTSKIGGLTNGQWYYVNVLQNNPYTVIALYSDYSDAITDRNRVKLYSKGTGSSHSLNLGARAYPIVTSSPVREMITTLRYDRTSYRSQITDWESGEFYAASFNGECATDTLASSSFKLENTQPAISSILASNDGFTLQIDDVNNEQITTWSAFERRIDRTIDVGNIIRLNPYESLEPNASGSTIGMTVDMPIRFVGNTGLSGLTANITYYVKEIINETDFTVSTTIGGPVQTVNEFVFPSSVLKANTAKVTNTAVLTVTYQGIRQVVKTNSSTNLLHIPLTPVGTGGTQGMYVNMPVEFVGNVFGGIENNGVYYVTTVADNENFSISSQPDPLTFNVKSILTDNRVQMDSTVGLNVNDPIIFNNYYISALSIRNGLLCTITSPGNTDFTLIGAPNNFKGTTFIATGPGTGTGEVTSNSFGGIISGKVYYVRTIDTADSITISETIGGPEVVLSVVNFGGIDGSRALLTSQVGVLQLTSETGSMTVNLCMPISQGQINKQQFTLYNTSKQYTDIAGTVSNYISGTVTGVVADGHNRLSISDQGNQLDNLYVNMPLQFATNIGTDFSAFTTYYIKDLDITEFEVYRTYASGNLLETPDASILYPNMPVVFSTYGLGGIVVGTTYFVKTIDTVADRFTVSIIPGGPEVTLTSEVGSMIGTGPRYFTLSATQGGSVITITSTLSTDTEFTQSLVGSSALFDVSWILGGYNVLVDPTDPGTGYAINNVIKISGNNFADAGGTSPANDITITVDSVDSTGQITNVIVDGNPPDIVNKYYLKVLTANTVALFTDPLCTVPVSGLDLPYVGITTTTVNQVNTFDITVIDSNNFEINDAIVFTNLNQDVYNFSIIEGSTYYVVGKSGNVINVSYEPNGTPINIFNPSTAMPVAFTTENIPIIGKLGSLAFLQQPFYFSPSIVKWNNEVWMCIISNHDDGDAPTLGKWVILTSGDRQLNAMDRVKGYYQPTINMPGAELGQLFEGVEYPNTTYYGKPFSPVPDYAIDTILQDQDFYPTNINTISIAYDGSSYIAPANLPEYSAFLLDGEANYWDIAKIANIPLGLTDIIYQGGYYVMTSTNSSTPIFRSNNGRTWTTNGYFTPYDSEPFDSLNYDMTSLNVSALSLSSVAYAEVNNIPTWVAVGKNIVTSNDTYVWNETYKFDDTLTNFNFNTVAYINNSAYTGFIAAGITDGITFIRKSANGIVWDTVTITGTKAINGIANSSNKIVLVGEDGVIYTSTDSITWTLHSYTAPRTLNDIIYANNIFMAVGDDGLCITSTDAVTWAVKTTGTLRKLNSLNYVSNEDGNTWTIVGNNNTIIQSQNNGVNWNTQNVFNVAEPVYTVQGDPFQAGYGPEELVPGNISDSFAMIVTTRPGTTWPATEYGHVGYNVVSREFRPTSINDVTFNFAGIVETPAQVAVFKINKTTGLSVSLYNGIDYTINWLNGTITLNGVNPLNYVSINNTDTLRIDVYEVGNGNQLVKSDTLSDPLLTNASTGFTEILLNCNYTAPLWEGSGVVKPNTNPVETFATTTLSLYDTIKVDDITQFTLNDQIYFSGSLFGGVSAETAYYVKTISISESVITISDSISGGIAGPTFQLSNGTGTMVIEIENGSSTVWTDPIVYVNGNKQILGNTVTVNRTKASNNAVVCNSTANFYANAKVTFSSSMFGNVISPLTTYYIKEVLDNNEFTISLTPGGSAIALTNATGVATLITEDYAIGLIPNTVKAKLIFAQNYDENDYITYTLFGESKPEQYGYTLPQTQVIIGDGSSNTFALNNYVGMDNAAYAIVEYNGLRLDNSDYTISDTNNEIELNFAPGVGNTLAITTFNDTQRQYFNVQEESGYVANIISITNTITLPIAQVNCTQSYSSNNNIQCSGADSFVVGQTAQFFGSVAFGNIQIDGTVYYVREVTSSTTFTISATQGGPEVSLDNGTGLMYVVVGGNPAVRVETGIPHNFTSPVNNNTKVRLAGIVGSTQLNNNSYYIHVISSTEFDLYEQPYDPNVGAFNYPVVSASTYVSGGYAWTNETFMIYDTVATGTITNEIVVDNIYRLVKDTPVYFTENGIELGQPTSLSPNIISGERYYITKIDDGSNSIRISTSYQGPELAIVAGVTGANIRVSQWLQTNVDRLWVTINGARVPSSSLSLGADNQLNILSVINTSDSVVITSMIPTATPNENVYINFVNKNNQGTVYRTNTLSRTYLTKALSNLDSTIYVNDASRLSNTIIQNAIAPEAVLNRYNIGLTVDKASIQSITVYNNTKNEVIDASDYTVEIVDMSPTLKIKSGIWISKDDSLTITMTEGRMIYINGEQILVGTVNLENNTLSDLTRGANGTGVNVFVPKYSTVYGLLPENRMSPTDYNQVWNPVPGLYNPTQGDPLQISITPPANFLKVDET